MFNHYFLEHFVYSPQVGHVFYYFPFHQRFSPFMNSRALRRSSSFPQVNPTQFKQSAQKSKSLLEEAKILLETISQSTELDYKIMSAAQKSNYQEVKRLLKSTGIHAKLQISFTPSGIQITLSREETTCCRLQLSLNW